MAQTGYTPIQIYSSSTGGNAPAAGNLLNNTVGSELAINIADGKMFYKDSGGSVQVIAWKTTPTTAGGTGLTTYAAGDLLYYATGTTLSKLAIGSSGQILKSTGSAPAWENVSALAVTSISFGTTGLTPSTATQGAVTVAGTLVAANGGTGQSSYTVGDILYASGTTALSKLADVATGNALISGGVGVAPSWGKIGLTTHVSGTLPIANGGTNQTSFTGKSGNICGLVFFDGTSFQNDATVAHVGYDTVANTFYANNVNFSGTVTLTTALPTGQGGTGLTSFTAGDMLYYASGTTLTALAIGSANKVLTSSGSAPQWSVDLSISKLTWSSKLVLTGNGSAPSASELAIGTNGVGSRLAYNVATGGEHDFSVNGANVFIAAAGGIGPGADNTETCGYSFWRWSVVYAATGTINTSDANTKQQINDLSAAETAVARRIKKLFKTFKFNDSVAEKGDGARIHVGVIAQEVKAAFEAEGLDPHRYGLFCFDEWEDSYIDEVETQIVIEDGEQVEKSVPTGKKILERAAGSRYGVRYEELLAFVIAAM